MKAHTASERDLLPRPRRARRTPGRLVPRKKLAVVGAAGGDSWTRRIAGLLRRTVDRRRHGIRTGPDSAATTIALQKSSRGRGEQWYRLRIDSDGIRLTASDECGFRYGALTLGQLLNAGGLAIQCMEIEDWPDFQVRGVMLDISRDRVPTMGTLERLIEKLACWKINQIQLYMEHTFAYRGHESVWRGASPMTGRQIRALDEFCRERCIELVPNQNSLGHLERWLKIPRYASLAECSGPWKTPWGEERRQATMLCPTDPRSVRLIGSLYGQLLPNFSSGLLNVGCDEPWELGQGRSRSACRRRGADRVYFDYLMKIRRLARRHGRRIMFWADWLEKYPSLAFDLPDDTIPLIWGYEADYPFDRLCARLARSEKDYYVCPGTSSWCSFGGRTRNCLTNLRRAARSGKSHRAAGYLITDWGDFGHRQYWPVSYGGFLYGAAASWCFETNADIDVAAALSRHVFESPSDEAGKLWLEAGRVHERSQVRLNNRTILFACMQAGLGDPKSVEGLAQGRAEGMAEQVAELEGAAGRATFGGPDGRLVKDELRATLAVLGHACKRAAFNVARRVGRRPRTSLRWFAEDMRRIIERHRALWLRRNRPGGLASSVSHYRRILKEYRNRMS